MELCTFIDTHTVRFRSQYATRAERLWRALVEEASQWFAVRPVVVDLDARMGTFGLADAPAWRARIIEARRPWCLAFDHPDEFEEGGRLRFDIDQHRDHCWLSMTQQFRVGARLTPTARPGGDVPVASVPFRPGFLAGFHLMFENLERHLAGEPMPTADQLWLDLLPVYRLHIIESNVP